MFNEMGPNVRPSALLKEVSKINESVRGTGGMMTGKHRSTRRQTCPSATFGYQVSHVTTGGRSVRLGVEVLHDQICCCVSLGTPTPTMYTFSSYLTENTTSILKTNRLTMHTEIITV